MSKKRPTRQRKSSPRVNGTTDDNISSQSPAPHFGAKCSNIRTQCRIQDPSEYDVLCGRGGAINNHKGNIHFRSLVNDKKETYNSTNKANKTQISRDIITLIKISKGMFLEKEQVDSATAGKTELSGLWVEVGYAKAMSKTSQALREGAPNMRAQIEGAVTPGSGNMSPNELYRSKFHQNRKITKLQKEVESMKQPKAMHPRITFLPGEYRGKHFIVRPSDDNGSAVTDASCPPLKKSRSDDITAAHDEDHYAQGNATTAGKLPAQVETDMHGNAELRFNSLGFNNTELHHNAKFTDPFQNEECVTNTPSLYTDNNDLDTKEAFSNPCYPEECMGTARKSLGNNDLFIYTDHDKLDRGPIIDIPNLNSSVLDNIDITDESCENDQESFWSGPANVSS